ncbi:response regulator transcription factor [Staphylococcus capitis]|uniref:response regulator transcription factor n=1 Tax=Staphylococcus capitis TaxID=29388 RepID=UPI0002DFC18D|nr:response regulator transcription factor [Staphylococcus capitis]QKH91685.1 response regulator transcription factor [Staphylococcus capitis]
MTHLLIVDDEQDIVDIYQTYFEYEGYHVTTTTNGKEAIKLLSSEIDVMILDIMMPEVTGYDIVKEMKAQQLEFNGLILKNPSKTLTINSEDIPMRIKEFELLWYLASRENEVISKSELLENVWGYDYYEDANTVNVHIHRIREKLEKHHFITYTITTVWGVGYKFERSR